MSPGFHQYQTGASKCGLPKETPMKKSRGSSAARIQDTGLRFKDFAIEPHKTSEVMFETALNTIQLVSVKDFEYLNVAKPQQLCYFQSLENTGNNI